MRVPQVRTTDGRPMRSIQVTLYVKLSCVILVTLGQYLQGKKQKQISKLFLNFVEMCILPGFRSGRRTIIARNDSQKQSIALEILYRNISLRFDLRSTVKTPEVTRGQGLYSRFGDFR